MQKKSWKVSEIAGFEVFDDTGRRLGILTDVFPTGANDVLVVKSDLPKIPEILIPAIASIIIDVDVAGKKIVVKLPEGLLKVYET